MLNLIKRTFPRITKHDFKLLYSVYIRPCLEYASTVATSGRVKDCLILERVQRRSTKLVHHLSHLPYEDRLVELNLYPLHTRRLRGDLMFLFSLFQRNEVGNFFSSPPHKELRGHNKKLFKLRPRTFIRQNFFSYRVVNVWNSLPSSCVNAVTKDAFKKELDKFLALS